MINKLIYILFIVILFGCHQVKYVYTTDGYIYKDCDEAKTAHELETCKKIKYFYRDK